MSPLNASRMGSGRYFDTVVVEIIPKSPEIPTGAVVVPKGMYRLIKLSLELAVRAFRIACKLPKYEKGTRRARLVRSSAKFCTACEEGINIKVTI